MMKTILVAASFATIAAFPALAQSTDGASTAGAPIMPQASQTTPDQMGGAATTGNTLAAPSTGTMSDGAMAPQGSDTMSTGSIDRDPSTIQTEGMDPNAAAAAEESTPSNGLVPGQSPN